MRVIHFVTSKCMKLIFLQRPNRLEQVYVFREVENEEMTDSNVRKKVSERCYVGKVGGRKDRAAGSKKDICEK